MPILYKYKTVKNFSESEIIEKKSRFISIAAPVSTENEALALIEKMRKKHYNASHNVYAYRVGLEREICRYSDDGEPSGTAGIPTLNLLNGEDLRNVIVVTTRYFGGTLLGTGGLVRAYTSSAREALTGAQVIEKNLYSVIRVDIDYGTSGKLQYEALKYGHYIYDIAYTSSVRFTILVEQAETEKFVEVITNISNATALIDIEAEIFGTKIGDIVTIDTEY